MACPSNNCIFGHRKEQLDEQLAGSGVALADTDHGRVDRVLGDLEAEKQERKEAKNAEELSVREQAQHELSYDRHVYRHKIKLREREGYVANLETGNFENDLQATSDDEITLSSGSLCTDINGETNKYRWEYYLSPTDDHARVNYDLYASVLRPLCELFAVESAAIPRILLHFRCRGANFYSRIRIE